MSDSHENVENSPSWAVCPQWAWLGKLCDDELEMMSVTNSRWSLKSYQWHDQIFNILPMVQDDEYDEICCRWYLVLLLEIHGWFSWTQCFTWEFIFINCMSTLGVMDKTNSHSHNQHNIKYFSCKSAGSISGRWVEQGIQDGLAASWILYVDMCWPAELTLNISGATELVPDLTGGWDKIFRMIFLLHSCHIWSCINQLT